MSDGYYEHDAAGAICKAIDKMADRIVRQLEISNKRASSTHDLEAPRGMRLVKERPVWAILGKSGGVLCVHLSKTAAEQFAHDHVSAPHTIEKMLLVPEAKPPIK